jgi:hypothetical protein
MLQLPPNALVIRFAPNSPEGVLRRARLEFRRSGRYRVSVFADVPGEGETGDEVIGRLLTASQLSGIAAAGNPKYWLCSSAAEIEALSLKFVKDGFEGEPPEHYSVEFDEEPDLEETKRFIEAFTVQRRDHERADRD